MYRLRTSLKLLRSHQLVVAASRQSSVNSLWRFQRAHSCAFSTATAASESTEFEFQAETSKLLDIVTNSIYTDKEIFLRELVSNASDALEKFRHKQSAGEALNDGGRELSIKITVDAETNTLSLQDSGIGMTKDEMMQNLGTIARSGSKAFIQEEASSDAKSNIIGQFGVGFYSAFMVGSKVKVYSRSATESDGKVHCWSSDGTGKFALEEVAADDEVAKDLQGTIIKIFLKDECKEFSGVDRVRDIVKKYSNYVAFPISVNGDEANSVSAIWTRDKTDISEEEYKEFYKFQANAFDDPTYRIHFKTDAPIDMKALLYLPSWHTEKMGMGRMDPGVSLYSRKVLVDANSEKILPNWLRFVKGVVDSEDLPISLSRENMQDSRLLANMNKVLSRKIIKELQSEAKKDKEKYNKFAVEFGGFIKEGVCSDADNQQEIAKLLRFNSSTVDKDELVSLDEYISRCSPKQEKIYYLSAPSRELAEASPYFEIFKRNNIEVLFLYNTLDDFAIENLGTFNGRSLVSGESGDLGLEDETTDDKDKLSEVEQEALTNWFEQTLADSISKVSLTTRLKDSPAIVVNHDSAALRRMMKMMQQTQPGAPSPIGKQQLEVNPTHPIIKKLNVLRTTQPQLADIVARQVYDNAAVAAGLVDDAREMLPRLYSLMDKLMEVQEAQKGEPIPPKVEEVKVEEVKVEEASEEKKD